MPNLNPYGNLFQPGQSTDAGLQQILLALAGRGSTPAAQPGPPQIANLTPQAIQLPASMRIPQAPAWLQQPGAASLGDPYSAPQGDQNLSGIQPPRLDTSQGFGFMQNALKAAFSGAPPQGLAQAPAPNAIPAQEALPQGPSMIDSLLQQILAGGNAGPTGGARVPPAPQRAGEVTPMDFSAIRQALSGAAPTPSTAISPEEQRAARFAGLAQGSLEGRGIGGALAGAAGGYGSVKAGQARETRLSADAYAQRQQEFAKTNATLEQAVSEQRFKEQEMAQKIAFENKKLEYQHDISVLSLDSANKLRAVQMLGAQATAIHALTAMAALTSGGDMKVAINGVNQAVKGLPPGLRGPVQAAAEVRLGTDPATWNDVLDRAMLSMAGNDAKQVKDIKAQYMDPNNPHQATLRKTIDDQAQTLLVTMFVNHPEKMLQHVDKTQKALTATTSTPVVPVR